MCYALHRRTQNKFISTLMRIRLNIITTVLAYIVLRICIYRHTIPINQRFISTQMSLFRFIAVLAKFMLNSCINSSSLTSLFSFQPIRWQVLRFGIMSGIHECVVVTDTQVVCVCVSWGLFVRSQSYWQQNGTRKVNYRTLAWLQLASICYQ